MALKKKTVSSERAPIAPKNADSGNEELSDFSRRKREQILRAATKTFLELGFEGSSMNLVAERAGVIKQTIYSHFHDKETLFVNVIAAITVNQVQHIFAPEFIKGKSPTEILRALGEGLEARNRDANYAKLFRTIVGESGRFPKVAQLFTTATIKPGVQLLTNYLENHPDINLPDPEAFARVFIGSLIHNSMQQNVLYGKTLLPFKSSRLLDELLRIFQACSSA